MVKKKEGFSADFGYKNNYQKSLSSRELTNQVIQNQLTPLEKINEKYNRHHDQLVRNNQEIGTRLQEYNHLLDILNEQPKTEQRTINIGSHGGSAIKSVTYDELDTSYQTLEVPKEINRDNNSTPGFPIGDRFNTNVTGKVVTVEKVAGDNPSEGWQYDLEIPGTINSYKDKKYYHHKDDNEFMEKRKTQREKYIEDTRTLLLYNNQLFIAGTITTALALIIVYKLNI